MKIKMQFFLLCFLLMFLLCACGHSPSGSSSVNSLPEESSVASVDSAASSISNADANCTLNYEVFDLVGGLNSQLLAYRDEECLAQNVGTVTDALTLYHPYLLVYYESWGAEIYTNDFVFAPDLKYQKNPYVDDLQIKTLIFTADRDDSTHQVVSQDSLKQLFETDDVLTYEIISACLGVSPSWEYISEQNEYSSSVDFDPITSGESLSTEGGSYIGTYIFEGKKIRVSFEKYKNEYIASAISLSLIKE